MFVGQKLDELRWPADKQTTFHLNVKCIFFFFLREREYALTKTKSGSVFFNTSKVKFVILIALHISMLLPSLGNWKDSCLSSHLYFRGTKEILSRRPWKKKIPQQMQINSSVLLPLCELQRVSLYFYVCKQHCTIALASVNSSRLWLGVTGQRPAGTHTFVVNQRLLLFFGKVKPSPKWSPNTLCKFQVFSFVHKSFKASVSILD